MLNNSVVVHYELTARIRRGLAVFFVKFRNQVMYDGVRGGGSYWYSLFFVTCVVLGQFVVLNLFLSVLLGNIDTIVSVDILFVADNSISTVTCLEPP